jgi:hypothetical protein
MLSNIVVFCKGFRFLLRHIRFALKNKGFWRKYLHGSRANPCSVVVTEVSNNVYITMGDAVAANIVAKVHHARVLYISHSPREHISFKWLRNSFSKSYYESVHEIVSGHLEEIDAEVNRLYDTLQKPDDILKLKYKGLLIGDIIYDSSMRNKPWQATVWKIDERVYGTLVKVVGMLFALESISRRYDVKAALSSHTVGFGGLLIRYFANQAIESYSGVAGGPIRKYLSFNGRSMPYRDTIGKVGLDSVMRDKETKMLLLVEADKYIENRLAGNFLEDGDSKRAFAKTKKEYTSKEEFCRTYGLSCDKPCVFVMLHAFNDFPHHFERYIFTDYYRWFIETLKIVRNVDSVNWIFKEHPSADLYPNDANLSGIFEFCNEPHILFLDKDSSFNSSSLRYIAHAVITCLGTAGLEFSCFGIPAVIAADNWYSGQDICYEPQTYRAYRELLENIIDSVKPLDKQTQECARLLLYLQYASVFGKTDRGKSFFGTTSASAEKRLENKVEKLLAQVSVQLEDPDILEFLGRMENFVADRKRECFYVNEYLESKLERRTTPAYQSSDFGSSVALGEKAILAKGS